MSRQLNTSQGMLRQSSGDSLPDWTRCCPPLPSFNGLFDALLSATQSEMSSGSSQHPPYPQHSLYEPRDAQPCVRWYIDGTKVRNVLKLQVHHETDQSK